MLLKAILQGIFGGVKPIKEVFCRRCATMLFEFKGERGSKFEIFDTGNPIAGEIVFLRWTQP